MTTQSATTINAPIPAGRFRFPAAAVLGVVLVTIIAVAMSIRGPGVDVPQTPAPADGNGALAYVGELHSEYLIGISRDWGQVPMTLDQQRLLNNLHSEYLIEIGATFITPMTHEQARMRGELHSEFLRELALGW